MTININRQTVFYAEAGQGEAVLLLHGWGTDHQLFAPLMQLLAAKYHVYALDFPGFGQSPEPAAPWCVDEYADLVLGFLRALNVRRCALLGHSFGGRVIIKLAARRLLIPEFPKLILVDAAGIRPVLSKKAQRRGARYQLGKRLLKPFPKLLEGYRNRHGSADYKAASPMMRQVFVKVVNEDLTALLPQIAQETLLIWGRNDTATPLADGQRMARDIPHAGLVILENCGHYSFIEQQAQFLRVMASFMGL